MFKKLVLTAAVCGGLGYELRGGVGYLGCRRLRLFSWDYEYFWVTRDEQPVGYWVFMALHTVLAGCLMSGCWAAPGDL